MPANVAHVIPVNDLVDHLDDQDGDCVCGPRTERVPTPRGDGWVYVHHALDGRPA